MFLGFSFFFPPVCLFDSATDTGSHSKKVLQGVQSSTKLEHSTETQQKGEGAAAPGLAATVFFSRKGEGRGRESINLLLPVPHLITKMNLTG